MKFFLLFTLTILMSCGKTGTVSTPGSTGVSTSTSNSTMTLTGTSTETATATSTKTETVTVTGTSTSTTTAVNPPPYANLDPNHLIAPKLLNAAVDYYVSHLSQIKNKNFLSIVDFTLYSGKARFFIIDMKTGAVKAIHVAHGSGSDPNNTGYAKTFSNTPGTNASSLGVYQTAETYVGKHGLSLKMDGLSLTNSNVRAREIVIHSADYVTETSKAGRSWGCFAVASENISWVISELKGGSIIYAGLE